MVERLRQVAWVLDYLPDIVSDLSRFHRIDDANSLEARVFFSLTWRLAAYGGLVAAGLRVSPEPRRPEPVAPQRPKQVAAPVTPTLLRDLNAQMGVNTFSFAAIGPND